jgi:AmiR/NasT family two-component response regulator
MIVAQARLSAETALAMLRASAFANNRPIDEVARDVVARRLRFEEGPR